MPIKCLLNAYLMSIKCLLIQQLAVLNLGEEEETAVCRKQNFQQHSILGPSLHSV